MIADEKRRECTKRAQKRMILKENTEDENTEQDNTDEENTKQEKIYEKNRKEENTGEGAIGCVPSLG